MKGKDCIREIHKGRMGRNECPKPKFTENYSKRGFRDWHLDHRYSIWAGFVNCVPAHVIGWIGNLEMIPFRKNMNKGTRCSITLAELMASYHEAQPYL